MLLHGMHMCTLYKLQKDTYSVLYKNVQFPTDPQALYREQYFSDKKNADIKVLLKVTK